MDVKTAARTLEIFEVFAREQEPLSLAMLARALDAPPSSCLYILRTLMRLGYVYGGGARRAFYPTRKLLDVASAIVANDSLLERLTPALTALRDETRETIILGKMQAERVVYLLVCEGSQTIRYAARAGDLKPLYSSAIGKALLADLAAGEADKVLKRLTLDRVTANTMTDLVGLKADLRATAQRGYSVSRGENVSDVMAIAKTIAVDGDTYAIGIAGPLERIQAGIDVQSERLIRACARLAKNGPGE